MAGDTAEGDGFINTQDAMQIAYSKRHQSILLYHCHVYICMFPYPVRRTVLPCGILRQHKFAIT
jgi:hypothetical protein